MAEQCLPDDPQQIASRGATPQWGVWLGSGVGSELQAKVQSNDCRSAKPESKAETLSTGTCLRWRRCRVTMHEGGTKQTTQNRTGHNKLSEIHQHRAPVSSTPHVGEQGEGCDETYNADNRNDNESDIWQDEPAPDANELGISCRGGRRRSLTCLHVVCHVWSPVRCPTRFSTGAWHFLRQRD